MTKLLSYFLIFLAVLGVLLIPFIPLAIIWALNTLGLDIPYTFWTWLAVLVLLLVIKPQVNIEKKA